MSRKLDGLEVANKIAKERQGKCLSDVYINNNTNMLWECKIGHRWKATLNNVKNKRSWCRKCADRINSSNYKMKDGLQIAKKIANLKNGTCLSATYSNNNTKLTWKCKQGHIWMANLANVKNSGKWCPVCAVEKRKITMLARYGVEHPAQNTKIALKMASSANNSCILFHWKTKEDLICIASYEKAVVGYLNKNKINFRWQPKTFKMPNGKTYRPDMYLSSTKKWIEIKGYMREKNKVKWNWFQSIKPNSELWDKSKLKSMGIL